MVTDPRPTGDRCSTASCRDRRRQSLRGGHWVRHLTHGLYHIVRDRLSGGCCAATITRCSASSRSTARDRRPIAPSWRTTCGTRSYSTTALAADGRAGVVDARGGVRRESLPALGSLRGEAADGGGRGAVPRVRVGRRHRPPRGRRQRRGPWHHPGRSALAADPGDRLRLAPGECAHRGSAEGQARRPGKPQSRTDSAKCGRSSSRKRAGGTSPRTRPDVEHGDVGDRHDERDQGTEGEAGGEAVTNEACSTRSMARRARSRCRRRGGQHERGEQRTARTGWRAGRSRCPPCSGDRSPDATSSALVGPVRQVETDPTLRRASTEPAREGDRVHQSVRRADRTAIPWPFCTTRTVTRRDNQARCGPAPLRCLQPGGGDPAGRRSRVEPT